MIRPCARKRWGPRVRGRGRADLPRPGRGPVRRRPPGLHGADQPHGRRRRSFPAERRARAMDGRHGVQLAPIAGVPSWASSAGLCRRWASSPSAWCSCSRPLDPAVVPAIPPSVAGTGILATYQAVWGVERVPDAGRQPGGTIDVDDGDDLPVGLPHALPGAQVAASLVSPSSRWVRSGATSSEDGWATFPQAGDPSSRVSHGGDAGPGPLRRVTRVCRGVGARSADGAGECRESTGLSRLWLGVRAGAARGLFGLIAFTNQSGLVIGSMVAPPSLEAAAMAVGVLALVEGALAAGRALRLLDRAARVSVLGAFAATLVGRRRTETGNPGAGRSDAPASSFQAVAARRAPRKSAISASNRVASAVSVSHMAPTMKCG